MVCIGTIFLSLGNEGAKHCLLIHTYGIRHPNVGDIVKVVVKTATKFPRKKMYRAIIVNLKSQTRCKLYGVKCLQNGVILLNETLDPIASSTNYAIPIEVKKRYPQLSKLSSVLT